MLTAKRLREVIDYCPVSGRLAYRSGRGNGGTLTKDGYLQVRIDRQSYFAHRVAWLYVHGEWPPEQIDHRNGQRSDNRLANLRAATHAENCQNVAPQKRHSHHIGVTWHKRDKKWQAQIRKDGRMHYLGNFDSEAEAASAYLNAKAALHEFQPVPRQEYGLADGVTQTEAPTH